MLDRFLGLIVARLTPEIIPELSRWGHPLSGMCHVRSCVRAVPFLLDSVATVSAYLLSANLGIPKRAGYTRSRLLDVILLDVWKGGGRHYMRSIGSNNSNRPYTLNINTKMTSTARL